MMTTANGAGSFSMVLVEDRASTRQVEALDLCCDEREILTNLPESYHRWLAAVYMRTHSKPASDDDLVERSGRATLIGDGRPVGIISPGSATEPPLVCHRPGDVLTLQVIARHLTRRPRRIGVRLSNWSLLPRTSRRIAN